MTRELERRLQRLEGRTDREVVDALHELATEFARKQGINTPMPKPKDLADALRILADFLPV